MDWVELYEEFYPEESEFYEPGSFSGGYQTTRHRKWPPPDAVSGKRLENIAAVRRIVCMLVDTEFEYLLYGKFFDRWRQYVEEKIWLVKRGDSEWPQYQKRKE